MTSAFELQLDPPLLPGGSGRAAATNVRFWLPKWSEQQQCHVSSNAPSATPARTSFACQPASPHSNMSSQHRSNRYPRSNQHHLSNSVGVAATPPPRPTLRVAGRLALQTHPRTATSIPLYYLNSSTQWRSGSRDTWRLKALMHDADADIITSRCSQVEPSAFPRAVDIGVD